MKSSLIAALVCAASITQAQTLSPQAALKTAFENRNAIVSAQLNVQKATLSSKSLGALPSTKFGVGQSTNPKQGLGATDLDLYVSQPIDISGRASANREVGKANILVAQAELRQSKLTVQTEVLGSYYAVAAATKLSNVADGLLELAKGLQTATQRRFEEGKVPEVQLTRSNIELERAVQAANLRKAQLEAAKKRLAGSLGVPAVELDIEPDTILASMSRTSFDLRPDILTILAQEQVALAEAKASKRSTAPELELIGLRSPWGQTPSYFGARIQLSFTVNDNGRSRFTTEAARKQAEALEALLQDTRKKAAAELSAIGTEIEAAQGRIKSYTTIQLSAKSLVEKSQRGFANGVGTLIDVLEANRALREIEQELAEARLGLNIAEAARYEATGTLLLEDK